ncbi:putative ATPase, V0 complex, c/d subunit, V-type ATP synthase subunit C [Helianthus anomalus]
MYGLEAMTFNIHSGYLEAIVRDQRSGLLTAADYNNIYQCETLDDIKMHLSATEYGPYLQNGIVLFGFVIDHFLESNEDEILIVLNIDVVINVIRTSVNVYDGERENRIRLVLSSGLIGSRWVCVVADQYSDKGHLKYYEGAEWQ